MKSAIRVAVGWSLLLGSPVFVGASDVAAQAAAGPAVAISGWRYEKGQSDLHVFHCEQPKCGTKSKVSYRIYAPGNVMTLEQYRESQQQFATALERRKPGLKVTILGIDGDKGAGVPRLYKARRQMTAANGESEFVVSGLVFGSRGSASPISSSQEEKASNANYALFQLSMMNLIETPAKR